MKKRNLILLMMIVAMIASIALSGCTLVRLNEERQAARSMATISYTVNVTNNDARKVLSDAGITDFDMEINVTRRELLLYTNSYYPTFSQYYGFDYEKTLGYVYDMLVAQRYYVLRGAEYLLNNASKERLNAMYLVCKNADYKATYGNKLSPEGLLTMAEWYQAVGEVNEQMQKKIDSYMSDEDKEQKDSRITAADNKISDFYAQGYFVTGVYLMKEVEQVEGKTAYENYGENGVVAVCNEKKECFESGLYKTDFVLSGTKDDSATLDASDLEVDKIFMAIEMTKGDKKVYVPRPVDDSKKLTVEVDADAAFVGKYFQSRTVSVTYTGRASGNEESGYKTKDFVSGKIGYLVAYPRTALKESADEVDYLKVDGVRYAGWNDATFSVLFKDKTLDTDNDVYKTATDEDKAKYDAMAALYAEPFVTTYEGEDKKVKDAYRQFVNALASQFGYSDEAPEDASSLEYARYTRYNGLYVQYNDEFMEAMMNAVEYEIGSKVEVTYGEIKDAYYAKVLQDKANYEELGNVEQIEKYFKDGSKYDLTKHYYVPLDALLATEYEIDPANKAYAVLFNADNTIKDAAKKYVKQNADGKYVMKYAYDNGDGTYTINAFCIGHILFAFDNNEVLKEKVSSGSVDGYTDLSDEQSIAFYKEFIKMVRTNVQIADKDELAEDVKDVDALYEYNDGELVRKPVKDVVDGDNNVTAEGVLTELANAIAGKDDEEAYEIFTQFLYRYCDDQGATANGYWIMPGNISNSWVTDFTDTARKIYFASLIGEDVVFDEAYTSYGMHYMTLACTPFDNVKIVKVADGVYALDYETVLDVEDKTQKDILGESLLTTRKSTAFSDWKSAFTEDEINSATSKDEKGYEKLVKEINRK